MKTKMEKPILTILQSTHASLAGLEKSGILDRHKRLLDEYCKIFHVVLYTCDNVDFSKQLNVEHKPVPWLPPNFGFRHLVFYLWLALQASHMEGIIKVFGSNIPTLPLVKFLSKLPMLVTYQFDYAGLSEQVYGAHSIRTFLSKRMQHLALYAADLLSVTTPTLKRMAELSFNKPVIILPNWVDLSQCLLASSNIRNPYLILYAGRLNKIKGIDILIAAFGRVRKLHPTIRLIICGEGEERIHLENQSQSLTIGGVEFLGSVPNSKVLELMSTSTVYVLPTLTKEGQPKALIEAMACGCACIASDVPGNNDLITDGENGLLVPPGDIESLAEGITSLIENQSLCMKYAISAKEKAKQFDWNIVIENDIKVLKKLATCAAAGKI
jgi:glycosyltransferase involved in cell wall biosynthesis